MTEHEDDKTTEIQPRAPPDEPRDSGPRRLLRSRDDRVHRAALPAASAATSTSTR